MKLKCSCDFHNCQKTLEVREEDGFMVLENRKGTLILQTFITDKHDLLEAIFNYPIPDKHKEAFKKGIDKFMNDFVNGCEQ